MAASPEADTVASEFQVLAASKVTFWPMAEEKSAHRAILWRFEPEHGFRWGAGYFLITVRDGFCFVSIVDVIPKMGGYLRRRKSLLAFRSRKNIGLIGGRYGNIPPGHQLSITHFEFREAIKRGLDIGVFIQEPPVIDAGPDGSCREEDAKEHDLRFRCC